MRIALFALLALPCVLPASAETLTGVARIIDADTVEIAGEKLRLEGIDAPESRQTCKRDGKRYDCGKEATSALRVKIGKASITCKGDTRDQYDRLIALPGGPGLERMACPSRPCTRLSALLETVRCRRR